MQKTSLGLFLLLGSLGGLLLLDVGGEELLVLLGVLLGGLETVGSCLDAGSWGTCRKSCQRA